MYNIWLAIVVLCVIIILCLNKCVLTSVALYCMAACRQEGGGGGGGVSVHFRGQTLLECTEMLYIPQIFQSLPPAEKVVLPMYTEKLVLWIKIWNKLFLSYLKRQLN